MVKTKNTLVVQPVLKHVLTSLKFAYCYVGSAVFAKKDMYESRTVPTVVASNAKNANQSRFINVVRTKNT